MEIELQRHVKQIADICKLIENDKECMDVLIRYLPDLNTTINNILKYAQDQQNNFAINEMFVLHVLEDIVYGIEHRDLVILLDVLKHGLLEIYQYTLYEL